jgi:hypothetical protein
MDSIRQDLGVSFQEQVLYMLTWVEGALHRELIEINKMRRMLFLRTFVAETDGICR